MSALYDEPLETICYLNDPIHNIPELLFRQSIGLLWEKNIFTIRSFINKEECTATIMLHKLDEQNEKVFNELAQRTNNCFYQKGQLLIIIDLNEKSFENIQKKLYNLVSLFFYQDIQYGYMPTEEFLRDYCGCSKEEKGKFIYDESKQAKSIEEYIGEMNLTNLYSPQDNRIYFNEVYQNCHLNYLTHKNRTQEFQ